MFGFLTRKLVYGFAILIGINLLTFVLFFKVNTPDDMARMQLGGKRVTPDAIEKWKAERGYDRPLFYNEKEQGVAQLTNTLFLDSSLRMFAFDFGQAEKMQFVADVEWISVIKSSYLIGVDGISFPLYLLSMVITLLVVIYSLDHVPSPGKPKAFFSLLLVLQTGMAGTFIAQDLILFFVFFELVLLPMFFLIGVWGGEQRQYASIKFFLYTMFGSALMLVAFLALFFKTGAESFSIPYLIENGEITEPLREGNLIGNGPQVLKDIDLMGNDFAMGGPGTCGKDGQGVPVGDGCPTLRVKSMTIGGTAA